MLPVLLSWLFAPGVVTLVLILFQGLLLGVVGRTSAYLACEPVRIDHVSVPQGTRIRIPDKQQAGRRSFLATPFFAFTRRGWCNCHIFWPLL